MKNTVYAFARELDVRAGDVRVDAGQPLCRELRARLARAGEDHRDALAAAGHRRRKRIPHAFLGTSHRAQHVPGRRSAAPARATSRKAPIECGLEGLVLLKTTDSGFSKFLRDEFTTLPDTDDRIFATSVTAAWSYNDTPDDWREIRERIRDDAHSRVRRAVQPVGAGDAVRNGARPCSTRSRRSRRSTSRCRTCIGNLVDLSPFELDNPNVLFVPTDEPHGSITARACAASDETPAGT